MNTGRSLLLLIPTLLIGACAEVKDPPIAPLASITARDSHATTLAFSADGDSICVADAVGFVGRYDAAGESKAPMGRFGRFRHESAITISSDCSRVLLGNGSGWDLMDMRSFDRLHGLTYAIRAGGNAPAEMAILPGNAGAVLVNSHGAAMLWRFDETAATSLFDPGRGGARSALAVSPDGRHAAIATFDRAGVRVLDLRYETLRTQIVIESEGTRGLAFAGDGEVLVVAERDDTLSVWDWRRGLPLGSIAQGRVSGISKIAAVPDSDLVLTGQNDGSLALWHTRTGLVAVLPEAHRGFVTALAVSTDGQRLASAAADNTIRIWRLDRRPSPAT